MAKVFGIHEIEVNAGLDEKTLKKLFKEFAEAFVEQSGWKMILLKGDRGQRAGKYAVIYEIKSVEERDRFSPAHNTMSKEVVQWFEEHKEIAEALMKKWAAISPTDTGSHEEYTDYIVLA